MTDFRPGLSGAERAGLESALEAAGILDAWLTPDGNLIDGDVIMVSGLAPVDGASCADLLVPAIDPADPQAAALPEQSVAAVLRAIGHAPGTAGAGGTWVSADGRWANGVLSGVWRKDQAGYIGEGAREAARRARIDQLERELTAERAAIGRIDASLSVIGARQERLADEYRAVPADDGVREAHTVGAEQRRQLARARTDHMAATAKARQCQEDLTAARSRAAEFAGDVGLPAGPGELAAVRDGLGAYRLTLAALWPAAEAAHAAVRAAADAAAELAESRQLLVEASERAAEAREEAATAAATYQELLATAGAAVEELQRRLAEALTAEVEQRTTLLSARKREILENHLLNEVAGTLHELITKAEAEVRQMNDELESRPTSTGMKLRLIWQQARNAPEGLDRVRFKLRQTIDAWSAADRALVGSFLQQRIAAEHADNPAAGWTEALTAALDYRGWHEFTIQRYSGGQWRPATGPASGGERALVVSVPLFAAASSHYKSAGNPHAPRLIALDEAFAGVDDDSRAKCLGLLATFDMDVVMTSEREWGCYPQVPGLGICQLARQDGIDAVLVTPWRWDGRERRRVDPVAV